MSDIKLNNQHEQNALWFTNYDKNKYKPTDKLKELYSDLEAELIDETLIKAALIRMADYKYCLDAFMSVYFLEKPLSNKDLANQLGIPHKRVREVLLKCKAIFRKYVWVKYREKNGIGWIDDPT